MSATVIIPTTGSSDLEQALNSVLNQTYSTKAYVVIDGIENYEKVDKILYHMKLPDMSKFNICVLPENVGANGFYGHRIYAAFTHLISTDYVLYLDQDCWMEPNHVESLVNTIESNNLEWAYSLRNICESDGSFTCQDNCESLGPKWPIMGYRHVDTNCYCIKTEVAIRLAQVWHGGWGQDRVWYQVLSQNFPNYDVTGKFTVNYRVGGNDGSVKKEFFEYGNKIMNDKYNGVFPWRKKI